MKSAVAGIFVLALTLSAAGPARQTDDAPRLEPLTGAPPFPADNHPTPEKIALGKELFFDNILSSGNRRSCGTCHKPELFFTDGFSRGWGLHESELRRKTPNLLNVGWQQSLFFDSRAKTLEEQASKPLENPHEMGLDPQVAAERVRNDPYYQKMFPRAFPGEEIGFDLIAKAIAAYERTLVSYDSDLDRYLLGDAAALSPEAKRGMDVFTGKAECIRCHHGPLLTDHQRHYTGVPEDLGDNPAGTAYKTQSLRDVMRRFSFMHNGSMLKIGDVLDHYSRGGRAPEGLEAEIRPVNLSAAERQDLIAFLRALNGRVTDLLDASPDAADLFGFKRGETPSGESGEAIQDPSYIPPTEEAEDQDPSYLKRPQER